MGDENIQFVKNAINFEITALRSGDRLNDENERIFKLANLAIENGFFLSGLTSDEEFSEFKIISSATSGDVRTVVHGMERLINADVYSGSRVYFFDECKKMFDDLKSIPDKQAVLARILDDIKEANVSNGGAIGEEDSNEIILNILTTHIEKYESVSDLDTEGFLSAYFGQAGYEEIRDAENGVGEYAPVVQSAGRGR